MLRGRNARTDAQRRHPDQQQPAPATRRFRPSKVPCYHVPRTLLLDPAKDIEAGYSWGWDGHLDVLALDEDRLVTVHDSGADVEATVRPLRSLVGVTASEIIDADDFSGYRWRVGTWQFTFADGFKVTASSQSGFEADHLTKFAQFVQARVR